MESEETEEDIKIDSSSLKTAMHQDEVLVVLLPKKKGEGLQGEVVKVLKRAKTRFVGTIEKKKSFSFLHPDDPKMYVDIFLPTGKVKNKEKALVEIVKWEDPKRNPEGKIIKFIGKKGDNDTELFSIVLERGLSIDFPESVEKEASEIQKKAILKEKRRDFTEVPTFTIDPKDAKDYDDALSVRKIKEDLYEVGVHIADVSHYVEEGSKLDKEARKRGFSIYLVDRTIPMLPDILSNDVCSLCPGVERMAFSAVFRINKEGEIKEKWFGETVIVSDKRFTYKEAQRVLDKGSGKFHFELSFLSSVSEKLRKKRIDKGALNIEEDELYFHLDHDGRPLSIHSKEHFFTHKIVEEFMILANEQVASNFNTLYRIHEPPDKKEINDLCAFLSNFGHRVEKKGKEITSHEINRIFEKIKGKDEEFLVRSVVLQSMSKAAYSTKNKKHFGLAIDNYTHFTSPIRRYADLLMHRIVKKKLKKEKVNSGNYEEVARQISLTELDVLDAERNSIAYKQVQYMMERVGETFEGVISGITKFGIFVREVETKAEGLISIRDMEDDYYVLDEETYSLIGMRKKKRYALGDKVKIKVAGGSVETKRLEFVFARS